MRISASQLNLWSECKRKFGFKYLDGVVVPPHKNASIGDEVQTEQLDPYLMTGRSFDFSKPISAEIANELSKILPKPMSPGLQVRRNFHMPSPISGGRFEYTGQLDIYAPDSYVVPLLDGGVPLVGDVKTTGNLKFAKTADVLKTDFQSMMYAMDIMFEKQVDAVDLVWFYGRIKPPHRTQRTYLRVYGDHVAEQFATRIEPLASEVAAIRLAKPKAEELTPNPLMCEEFGGCPYRHICNLSPVTFSAAVNEAYMEAKANFFDDLKKKLGAPAAAPAAPAAAPVAAAPTPAPVAPPAVNPFAPAASAAAPLSPFQKLAVAEAERQGVPAGDFVPTGKPVQPPAINPPESQLAPAPPIGAAAPPAAAPARRGRLPKVPATEAATPAPVPMPAAPSAAVTNQFSFAGTIKIMKEFGVKRFRLGEAFDIELFEDGKAPTQ